MKRKILIIDDEISMCMLLQLSLKSIYSVQYATEAAQGIALVEREQFDIVLLDLKIGADDGIDALRRIKVIDNSVVVIMMTAFGSIKTSVEAIKNGAFTYVTKPLDMDELSVYLQQAVEMRQLHERLDYLSDELESHMRYREIVGSSQPMRAVYDLIDKLKDVDASVTISGESGTGKELVARAIHFSGRRADERFVVINCAAIPESMLEEELFGHRKGSFTGAVQDKKGKFELADGGTIFLDEIGDMPIGLQAKLLRVLQQKEFTPLGGAEVRHVDVRILAATNRNLSKLVEQGLFRADLYYRLNVVNLHMPALRERKQDIELLAAHFLEKFCREQNKPIKTLSQQAKRVLLQYDYPGNVRQLANILEYATILSGGAVIEVESLPDELRRGAPPAADGDRESAPVCVTLDAAEKQMIAVALQRNGGRRDMTARELGISVRGLQNKIARYGLF